MNIKQTAKALGITERHMYRLVYAEQVPAVKIHQKVQVVITVNEWFIPDEIVQAAFNEVNTEERDRDFGTWLECKCINFDVTLEDIARAIRTPIHKIEEMKGKEYASLDRVNLWRITQFFWRQALARRASCK